MRRVSFFVFALLPLMVCGQNGAIENKQEVQKADQKYPLQDLLRQKNTGQSVAAVSKPTHELEQLEKKASGKKKNGLNWDTIGTTNYDLQTNTTLGRRINVYSGNRVSIVWAKGSNGPGYNDRRTGYNHFNGNQWLFNSGNVTKQENFRTGWPNIEAFGSGPSGYEMILSHIAGDPNLGSGGYGYGTNTSIGGSNFTFSDHEAGSGPLWYRTASTGDWLHMVGTYSSAPPVINGIESPLVYYRSDNRGQTFLDSAVLLPGYANTNKRQFGVSDIYSIDAHDNVVAIVVGENIRQLTLWKSTDYGATWNYQEIESSGYDYNTIQNGVWNLDTVGGNVQGGTDTFSGNQVTTVVEDNGTIHVAYNIIQAYRDDPNSNTGAYRYRPFVNGIKYWNDDNFGEPVMVGATPTINSFSDLSYTGSSSNRYPYGAPIASRPTIANGDGDTLYIVYEGMVANTGVPSAQIFDYRDLYLAYSVDAGNSWSEPTNLTQNATNNRESVYPSLYKEMMNGKLHLAWQEDAYPDVFASADNRSTQTFETNNLINHMTIDKSWIFGLPLKADFKISKNGNTVQLTDQSQKANEWYWTFGDDSTAQIQNPSHTYKDSGTYEICLTVQGNNDADTTCKKVTIDCPLVTSDFIFSPDSAQPTVEFTNQSSTSFELKWDLGNGETVTGENPSYNYEKGGDYEVCLKATNECGNSDSLCKTVEVNCPEVTSDFTINENGLNVNFTYEGLNGDGLNWYFGDNNSDTGSNVTHTYENEGEYDICLIALNECGSSDTSCKTVELESTSKGFGDQKVALNIYPNPVKNQLQIDLPESDADFRYEVFNVTGQLFRKGHIAKSSKSHTLNLSEFSQGVYWMKVSSKEKQWVEKIVVDE